MITIKYQSVKTWGVVYSMSLGREGLAECIRQLDVINLWVWHAKDVVQIEKYVARLENEFPGKPAILGLYLRDYGGGRKIPMDLLKLQCETALKLAQAGRIEGMVFLTIDNDPEAVGWVADWIKRVGSQVLRPPADQSPASAERTTHKMADNWPCWIEGPGDPILCAVNRGGKAHVMSSSDQGKSWQPLSAIEVAGQEIAAEYTAEYFTRLSEKSLLLTVVSSKKTEEAKATRWVNWVRSDDNGKTWSGPTPITSLANHVYAYGPVCVMSDGRWAYCPYYEELADDGRRKFRSMLVWSTDEGKTWSKPIAFPLPADGNIGLTEATVVELGPGDYLAAIRADEWPTTPEAFDGFYFSRSTDGLTWSVPETLCERGRMPLFYRLGDLWALTYRLYDAPRKLQHSAIRFSRDGREWTDPAVIESGVNAGPQLVRVAGKLLAFNNQFPDRNTGTRIVVKIPDWVYQQTGTAAKQK